MAPQTPINFNYRPSDKTHFRTIPYNADKPWGNHYGVGRTDCCEDALHHPLVEQFEYTKRGCWIAAIDHRDFMAALDGYGCRDIRDRTLPFDINVIDRTVNGVFCPSMKVRSLLAHRAA